MGASMFRSILGPALCAVLLAGCGDGTSAEPKAGAPAVADADPVLPPCEGCVVHTVKITNKWDKPIARIHFSSDPQPDWARSALNGTLDSGETETVSFDSWERICNFFIRATFEDGEKQIIMHDECGYDAATFEKVR